MKADGRFRSEADIPAGEFTIGSPKGNNEEEPRQHSGVFQKPFAVSKLEVTFDEWDACTNFGDCDRIEDSQRGRGRQPVINVSWGDAQRYVSWLSRMTGKPYRLLSEAEWEYSARAKAPTVYSWGDDIGTGNANCKSCGSRWDERQPAPVGQFPANQFGLHDMLGNVWEWVEDCRHSSYSGAPEDGSAWTKDGDCSYRIVRGGSWNDDPPRLRLTHRGWNPAGIRYDRLGFRVARTLTP